MALTSAELFQHVLQADREIAERDIEHMLKAKRREDLHLDWKGGKIATGDGGAQTVRKAVAGFANAEGGVLVLGANGGDAGSGETPWCIDPLPEKVGKLPIREWVEQALVPLRPNLRPLPRVVPIGSGIMAIGVHRSDQLVQCVEGSRGLAHYLRFYGSTQEVPGYLLADLLLGRRRQPRFDLKMTDRSVGPTQPYSSSPEYSHREAIELRDEWLRRLHRPWAYEVALQVTNSSLIWADAVTCGVLLYQAKSDDRSGSVPEPVREVVTINELTGHSPVHYMQRGDDLAPFEMRPLVHVSGTIPSFAQLDKAHKAEVDGWVREHPMQGSRPERASPFRLSLRFPLYVASRGNIPLWFQGKLTFDGNRAALPDLCSITPADDVPLLGLTVEYMPPDESEFVPVAGLGEDPLRRLD